MGELIIVRHGQANSAATDEASYDRLSDLGRTQARWLGEWFAGQAGFDRVLSGTMKRQVGTAQEIGHDSEQNADFNELDYYSLSGELLDKRGKVTPVSPAQFATHSVELMQAWERGDIGTKESFHAFESRVADGLNDALALGTRVLCVTSGGVISMMLRQLLGLSAERMANMMLPIYNSSVHRVIITELYFVDGVV